MSKTNFFTFYLIVLLLLQKCLDLVFLFELRRQKRLCENEKTFQYGFGFLKETSRELSLLRLKMVEMRFINEKTCLWDLMSVQMRDETECSW
jgi:hypothetical protein